MDNILKSEPAAYEECEGWLTYGSGGSCTCLPVDLPVVRGVLQLDRLTKFNVPVPEDAEYVFWSTDDPRFPKHTCETEPSRFIVRSGGEGSWIYRLVGYEENLGAAIAAADDSIWISPQEFRKLEAEGKTLEEMWEWKEEQDSYWDSWGSF